MPAMKQPTLSDSSFPEFLEYNIDCEINSKYTQLLAIIAKETILRRELDSLFAQRKEQAHEMVRKAESHLESVTHLEANMRAALNRESAAAASEVPHEIVDSPGKKNCQEAVHDAINLCHSTDNPEPDDFSSLGYQRLRKERESMEEELKLRDAGLAALREQARQADQREEHRREADRIAAERFKEGLLELARCEAEEDFQLQEDMRFKQEQIAAEEEGKRDLEYAEEQEHIAKNEETAWAEADRLKEEEARRVREAMAAEEERQKEAAIRAAVEERRPAEARKARQAQEEANRLAKFGAKRLAELEKEILAKGEANRAAVQETSMIAAIEERCAQEERKRREELEWISRVFGSVF